MKLYRILTESKPSEHTMDESNVLDLISEAQYLIKIIQRVHDIYKDGEPAPTSRASVIIRRYMAIKPNNRFSYYELASILRHALRNEAFALSKRTINLIKDVSSYGKLNIRAEDKRTDKSFHTIIVLLPDLLEEMGEDIGSDRLIDIGNNMYRQADAYMKARTKYKILYKNRNNFDNRRSNDDESDDPLGIRYKSAHNTQLRDANVLIKNMINDHVPAYLHDEFYDKIGKSKNKLQALDNLLMDYGLHPDHPYQPEQPRQPQPEPSAPSKKRSQLSLKDRDQETDGERWARREANFGKGDIYRRKRRFNRSNRY